MVYGIPGGKRAAAIEAISCAEAAGAAANAALHRALVNLFIAKVTAAEGLDTGLLDRAAGLEASLPPTRLHDSADSASRVVPLRRGPGHRAGRAAAVHSPGQGYR